MEAWNEYIINKYIELSKNQKQYILNFMLGSLLMAAVLVINCLLVGENQSALIGVSIFAFVLYGVAGLELGRKIQQVRTYCFLYGFMKWTAVSIAVLLLAVNIILRGGCRVSENAAIVLFLLYVIQMMIQLVQLRNSVAGEKRKEKYARVLMDVIVISILAILYYWIFLMSISQYKGLILAAAFSTGISFFLMSHGGHCYLYYLRSEKLYR